MSFGDPNNPYGPPQGQPSGYPSQGQPGYGYPRAPRSSPDTATRRPRRSSSRRTAATPAARW